MDVDNDKLYLYISKKWLKTHLKFFASVIIPYNLVLILLWKLSVLPNQTWNILSIWGTFAIAFVWSLIRKRRATRKDNAK